jgi:hypothetical protein
MSVVAGFLEIPQRFGDAAPAPFKSYWFRLQHRPCNLRNYLGTSV